MENQFSYHQATARTWYLRYRTQHHQSLRARALHLVGISSCTPLHLVLLYVLETTTIIPEATELGFADFFLIVVATFIFLGRVLQNFIPVVAIELNELGFPIKGVI
jgi:hypothetical protein